MEVVTTSGSVYSIVEENGKLFMERNSDHCITAAGVVFMYGAEPMYGAVKGTEKVRYELRERPNPIIGERLLLKLKSEDNIRTSEVTKIIVA